MAYERKESKRLLSNVIIRDKQVGIGWASKGFPNKPTYLSLKKQSVNIPEIGVQHAFENLCLILCTWPLSLLEY